MKESAIRIKSTRFALDIIPCYKNLSERHEYVLSKQLLRSGTATGALCVEGEHAQSKPDFLNKMNVALKEANETDYWLLLLRESSYIDETEYQHLNSSAQEITSILVAIVKTTKMSLGR